MRQITIDYGNKFFCTILLLVSFCIAYFLDKIAFLGIAKYINYILFCIVFFISLKDFELGIVVIFSLCLLFLEYPRDILNLYEDLQITNDVQYFTLASQSIAHFTLLQILILFNALYSIYRVIILKTKIPQKAMYVLYAFFCIGLLGLIYNLLFCQENYSKFGVVITDLKFIVLLFSGFFVSLSLTDKFLIKLTNALKIVLLIAGYRVIFFCLNDITSGQLKLDFSPLSYLALAYVCYYVYTNDRKCFENFFVLLGVLLNFVNTSRSFYLFFVVGLFISGFLAQKKSNFIKVFFIFSIFLIIAAIFLSIYQPVIFNFILWKLNVFKEISGKSEMSGSGSVRILELKNIVWETFDNPLYVFFGKGYGGAYRYSKFPEYLIGETLSLDSYSLDQLESHKYYLVHNFTSQMILKYGFIGLIMYLSIPLVTVKKLRDKNYMFLVFYVILGCIYTYYWRPELAFLMGVLFSIGGKKIEYFSDQSNLSQRSQVL